MFFHGMLTTGAQQPGRRAATFPRVGATLACALLAMIGAAPASSGKLPLERLFATPSFTVVRATDRPTAILPGAAVVDTLITPPHEPHVTVVETLAAPGGSGGDGYYTIPSECEVCYVLEGTIELEIDGEVFALARGDAVTFGATVPHTWRNTSAAEARVVWVIAPALPDPRGQAAVP